MEGWQAALGTCMAMAGRLEVVVGQLKRCIKQLAAVGGGGSRVEGLNQEGGRRGKGRLGCWVVLTWVLASGKTAGVADCYWRSRRHQRWKRKEIDRERSSGVRKEKKKKKKREKER